MRRRLILQLYRLIKSSFSAQIFNPERVVLNLQHYSSSATEPIATLLYSAVPPATGAGYLQGQNQALDSIPA